MPTVRENMNLNYIEPKVLPSLEQFQFNSKRSTGETLTQKKKLSCIWSKNFEIDISSFEIRFFADKN